MPACNEKVNSALVLKKLYRVTCFNRAIKNRAENPDELPKYR